MTTPAYGKEEVCSLSRRFQFNKEKERNDPWFQMVHEVQKRNVQGNVAGSDQL